MRCWIDTDVGYDPDDAITLLCAAAHPDVELIGVSTVDGELEYRAAQARLLVPDVPVFEGPPPPDAVAQADALLAIGPWTHVAELARLGALPPRVSLMGGTRRPTEHLGITYVVDHNIERDVPAARETLRRTTGALVTTLDITATLKCTPDEEARMAAACPPLAPMLARWDHVLCVHDPLAFLALCGEPGIATTRITVAIDMDGRLVDDPDGVDHEVVTAADRDAVVARVLELLE